jgi:hypothetical protein
MTPLGGNQFKFKLGGEHANLIGITNPVTVKLTIGNDCSTTPVTAKFEKDHTDRDRKAEHHERD